MITCLLKTKILQMCFEQSCCLEDASTFQYSLQFAVVHRGEEGTLPSVQGSAVLGKWPRQSPPWTQAPGEAARTKLSATK